MATGSNTRRHFGESEGKAEAKLGNIANPEDPVRRLATVREHHKITKGKCCHMFVED